MSTRKCSRVQFTKPNPAQPLQKFLVVFRRETHGNPRKYHGTRTQLTGNSWIP